MFWKKMIIYLVVPIFMLAVSGSLLWAGDSDTSVLIELLKKKNIITQQEAEELTKEVAKVNQDKELKAAKAGQAKGADAITLPPALQGFKFSSTIFAEWNNYKPDNGPSSNQFTLNRAYLTLTKDFNDWLSMNLTTDITSKSQKDTNSGSLSATSSDQGWELRLKYAYINLKYLGTNTQAGLIPTPSDAYDSAIWPYRVQGKHLFDDLSIQASADYGISNAGYIGGVMDDDYLKYASKNFAGKWGGWMVGIYNGPGYTTTDSNNRKAYSVLAYVRPLPMVPVLKGLQLAYTRTEGESNSTFGSGLGVTTDHPNWQANIIQASLQHPMFTVMGQYYWGHGTATSAEQNDRRAYLIDAFARIPMVEKARVFGKYYAYNNPAATASAADNNFTTTVLGLSYDLSKELMPFVAWEHRSCDSSATPTTPPTSNGVFNYDKYQAGFQLKF